MTFRISKKQWGSPESRSRSSPCLCHACAIRQVRDHVTSAIHLARIQTTTSNNIVDRPVSALTSSLLLVLILVLVVDDISSFKIKSKAYGDAERPLYGIILNAPYPKPIYSGGPYQPYLPYRPVQHSRPHPVPYVKPPGSYYPTPSYYPMPPPPPPSVVPYQQVYNVPTNYQQQSKPQEPYRPPVRPAPEPYRPAPEPYRPAPEPYPVRPAPFRPPTAHRPNFPIPTSFDNKPWSPIPTSASYVLDPAVQLNELDGYPWTPELRENDEKEEELKDKIPDVLFKDNLPSKSLAQQHASANEINFSPNPERD